MSIDKNKTIIRFDGDTTDEEIDTGVSLDGSSVDIVIDSDPVVTASVTVTDEATGKIVIPSSVFSGVPATKYWYKLKITTGTIIQTLGRYLLVIL